MKKKNQITIGAGLAATAAIAYMLLFTTASGATLTVGAGKMYQTVADCANAAQPGDTCDIYAGSYAGLSLPRSGTSENARIIFKAHTGEAVTITSMITVSGRSYITISGLTMPEGMRTYPGSHYLVVENNTMGPTRCLYSGTDGWSDQWIVRGNHFIGCYQAAVMVEGSYHLIEDNDFYDTPYDFFYGSLQYSVMRNNRAGYFHDMGGDHVDAIQIPGSATWARFYRVLVEGNEFYECLDYASPPNCHFMLIRTQSTYPSDHAIIRYNWSHDYYGADGVMMSTSSGDANYHPHIYNNTFNANRTSISMPTHQFYGQITAPVAKNELIYNDHACPSQPFYGSPEQSGNLVRIDGSPTCSWGTPYSNEATYARLHNLDPLFVDYPTNPRLQSGSQAFGVPLTTVASSGSGVTTVSLTDAGYFRVGLSGKPGDLADWIRIGASTYRQLTDVDYTANTVTLASSVTVSAGDSVYLYKKSDGEVVLTSATPYVGAFPYLTTPAAPSSVTVTMAGSPAVPTLQWTHAGTYVSQFKYVDGGTTVDMGYPTPSGSTFSYALTLTPGAHTLIVQACNGGGCVPAAAITVVKL